MKSLRIGNACGFWGDSIDAPIHLTRDGQLDYLTLEYLAELTMSILVIQKQRDPQMGYARDFISVLERLCPFLHDQPNLKIITNAGGMNPAACAGQARIILDRAGLSDRKIAAVSGDDLLPQLDTLLSQGHVFTNLDTGESLQPLRQRVVSANAYLGARPIVEALQQGASIVITGRVADASLTVGPAVHELGWGWDDWDRLAAATAAGHLIECGAQVTGGLWMNWQEADLTEVGYPFVDFQESGTFRIGKPANTGGAVNLETVAEQLLYEVADPAKYLTPDVVADFTSVRLEQVGADVVEVSPAKGKPATDSYKVSLAYRDGFAAAGTLVISGPDAVAKAKACGEVILGRLRRAGITLEQALVECLGAGSCVPIQPLRADVPEVVLRVSVRDPDRGKVERFTRELAPLVTSGPPGVTGYTTGRPTVREVFAYWPTLISKQVVQSQVRIF
jgi:hypothetical protein